MPDVQEHATSVQSSEALLTCPCRMSATGAHPPLELAALQPSQAGHETDGHFEGTSEGDDGGLSGCAGDPQGTPLIPQAVNSQAPLLAANSLLASHPLQNGLAAPVLPTYQPYPSEWKSKWLRKPTLIAIALVTLALLGTVIGLLVRSISHRGLRDVHWNRNAGKAFLPELRLSIGIMWTVFPALVFQVYSLTAAAVVKAAAARQPFIELRRDYPPGEGAAAEKSIFLDYESFILPLAPFRALRYNHYMLCYGFTTIIVVSVGLTALASHLLTTAELAFEEPTTVNADYSFNSLGFTARSDIAYVIDSVASTQIHGGRPSSWTTSSEAFLPVALAGVPDTARLEFNTTAYSAIPHCRVLRQPEEFVLAQDAGGWYVNMLDNGCRINHSFFTGSVSPFVNYYIKTYLNGACGAAAHESRFAVVAASNFDKSAAAFSAVTAISCTPSYNVTTGRLSVSVDTSRLQDPGFNTFSPNEDITQDYRPAFANPFERQIDESGYDDASNRLQASAFGRLVYLYARSVSENAPLGDDVFAQAVDGTFRAAFAAMASRFLVQKIDGTSRLAVYYRNTTRLVIFPPVAYTMIGVLALVLIMLGWVGIYTHSRHHLSVLYEDPVGLAGAAAVLRHSELMVYVQTRDAAACQGRVASEVRDNARLNPHPRGWILQHWDQPAAAHITSTRTPTPFGWREVFKR